MTDYHQLRELRSDLRDCRHALEQAEREREWLKLQLHEVEHERDSYRRMAHNLSANKETDQSD